MQPTGPTVWPETRPSRKLTLFLISKPLWELPYIPWAPPLRKQEAGRVM